MNKWQKVAQKGRKCCGKRSNLQAISPFPTVFSKDLLSRHVKTRACLGKGYPLSDDKILALSKLKAFADDDFNVAQMEKFFSDRADSIVGKGDYGFQHFLPFPQRAFFSGQ